VRVSVDFPGAEGIWVVAVPVHDGERISRALGEATEMLLESLARDAGRLYVEARGKS
jgi:hypothetical protein